MEKTKRLILLSHCDDEIYLLPFLLDKNAESTVCFFTTRSIKSNSKNIRRQEAVQASSFLNSFQKLEAIHLEPEIFDGRIYKDFSQTNFDFLSQIIERVNPDELLTLAFEGGHHDHDAVEVISRALCNTFRRKLITCPAYSSSKISRNLFRVMKVEGPTETIATRRILNIYAAIRLMLIYRSQLKTWIGLSPFIIIRYAFFSYRIIQVDLSFELKRVKGCLYEKRNRAVQDEVLAELNQLMLDVKMNNSDG
jgi:LmbE family N-acetylglucosaminyl deacetylase